MGEQTFFNKIMSIVSGLSFRIFLWSLQTTPDKYWRSVYEIEKEIINKENTNTESKG
jgi:hypothetical protein